VSLTVSNIEPYIQEIEALLDDLVECAREQGDAEGWYRYGDGGSKPIDEAIEKKTQAYLKIINRIRAEHNYGL
jgi:hypothetical protein